MSNNQDWNSFKAEVLPKTDSEEINFNLKKKLFALKQDTSFDKFLTDFEYLTYKITDLSDKQKFDIFLHGLKPKNSVRN